MFGLDDWLLSLSDGTRLVAVLAVAVLLGLRHASDPDHLAAVATLFAGDGDRRARRAGALGVAWGTGHAVSLFAFGVPIVLFKAYLPEAVRTSAETVIGLVIASLAVWLLVRWRRGVFHAHLHEHDGSRHLHVHGHTREREHAHRTTRPRSRLGAFAIGLVHGIGGSAGVGILLLATIHDHAVALAALGLFAVCTALSMTMLSTGFGLTLSSGPARRSLNRLAPALGGMSLVFGVWYALGAQGVVPYSF